MNIANKPDLPFPDNDWFIFVSSACPKSVFAAQVIAASSIYLFSCYCRKHKCMQQWQWLEGISVVLPAARLDVWDSGWCRQVRQAIKYAIVIWDAWLLAHLLCIQFWDLPFKSLCLKYSFPLYLPFLTNILALLCHKMNYLMTSPFSMVYVPLYF